jgi:hypothetical protein
MRIFYKRTTLNPDIFIKRNIEISNLKYYKTTSVLFTDEFHAIDCSILLISLTFVLFFRYIRKQAIREKKKLKWVTQTIKKFTKI